MKVKPVVAGAIIRDPITRLPLPAEGGEVSDNTFWRRRLLAGEVVVVKDEARSSSQPTGLEPVAPLTTREES